MLSQLVILQFLCDTQTHQPRTHLSQSRAQLPGFTLLAQRKRRKLCSISPSFFILLLMHSYNNYPCVKNMGKLNLHRSQSLTAKNRVHLWLLWGRCMLLFLNIYIKYKVFHKAQLLPFSTNSQFEPPLPYPWCGCSHLCWPQGISSPAQLDRSTWAGRGSLPQETRGLWNSISMYIVSSKLDQICFYCKEHHFLTSLTPEQTVQWSVWGEEFYAVT